MDLLADFELGLERLLEVATTHKQHNVDLWLDAIKDDDQYEKFITSCLDETCHWILSHPAYTTWESKDFDDGGAKLLWINGPAGFGKTILSAWLIRHVREILDGPLAYCFSSSHARRIDELDGIARTWITQLIRKDKALLDLAHQICQRRNTRRASRDDVWTLLKEIATHIQSCVLVLNGLDEFQSVDHRRARFLSDLKKAIQATRFRVLITSRNEFDKESELRTSATESPKHTILDCKISKNDVKDDIGLVSQSIVARKLPKQEHRLRQNLATKMAERCNGQFLWLILQQERLRDSKSAKALQDIVQAMPKKLHAFYERSWDGIQALEESDRGCAIDTLRWLTFAYRPLIVQELAEALTISLDSDTVAFSEDDLPNRIDDEYIDGEIKNLCGSHIELRDGTPRSDPKVRTVHLVHASVNEFLVEKLPVPSMVASVPNRPRTSAAQHAKLAAHCIRFLDCQKAWDLIEGDRRSFTIYAGDSWFRHLRDSEGYYEAVSDLVNSFMRPGNERFKNWKKTYEQAYFFAKENPATSFYYACQFGLVPAMDFLHNNEDLDINCVGGQYGTPLQAVCTEGYTEAFEYLIQWKADVTVRGGQFGNALNAAAYHGRINMVKVLLGLGASKYSLDPRKSEAMIMAAGQGHVDVVRLFLDQGADINAQARFPSFYQRSTDLGFLKTPLQAAAENGHMDVMKILFEQGADPNKMNDEGNTALHLAATENFLKTVGLLLQYGADVNNQGSKGAPLHLAALYGYLNIVVHLVDWQAMLDACDGSNLTPLYYAAQNGHAEVVDFLLEKGADVNIQSKEGWTPLHTAIYNGHLEVANFLLQKGSDIYTQNESGWTPLHTAIHHGYLDVANSLLQKGATLQPINAGWTPLHLAARYGFFDLVMSLIHHGADKNAKSHNGWTSLHLAVEKNHLEVVESLLEHGAAIKPSNAGWTPLHLAARQTRLNITTRLLERGADIDAQDEYGWTPLAIAIPLEKESDEQEHLEEVKLLLEQGATFATNKKGWTPLHVAAETNCPQIVALFLDQGGSIDAQTIEGFTALHLAIDSDSLDAAELLVNRGADLNISAKTGLTALHLAAGMDSLNLVQNLIKRNGNLNAISDAGASPLQTAIWRGTNEIIEFLIRSGADLDVMDCYGIRCSDWLKRIRPILNVPQSALQEVDDTSSGPDTVVLVRTLLDLVTKIRTDESERPFASYILAHCFLLFGMEDDARLAYQQNSLLRDDRKIAVPHCNQCRAPRNRFDPFFTCKTCPSTDLCKSCMDERFSNA